MSIWVLLNLERIAFAETVVLQAPEIQTDNSNSRKENIYRRLHLLSSGSKRYFRNNLLLFQHLTIASLCFLGKIAEGMYCWQWGLETRWAKLIYMRFSPWYFLPVLHPTTRWYPTFVSKNVIKISGGKQLILSLGSIFRQLCPCMVGTWL